MAKQPIPKLVYIYDRRDLPAYIAIALDPSSPEFDVNEPRHSGLGALVDTGTNWYLLKRAMEEGGAEVTLSQELQATEKDMNDDIDTGTF